MKGVYSDLGLLIYFALTFNWFQQVPNEYLVVISFISSTMIKGLFNLLYTKEKPINRGSTEEKSCLCSHILSKKLLWKIKFDIDNGRVLETNISLRNFMEALRVDCNYEKAPEAEDTVLLENLLQKIILQAKLISNINIARSKSAKQSSLEENHSLEEILTSFKSLNISELQLNDFMEISIIKNENKEVTKVLIRQTQKDSSHYEMIFLPPQIEKYLHPDNLDIIQERRKLSEITAEMANIISIINSACNFSESGRLIQNRSGESTVNHGEFKNRKIQTSSPEEYPRIDKFGCVGHIESLKYIKSLSSLLLHQLENLKILNKIDVNSSFQSASELELIPALDFCLELFQIRQIHDPDKNNLAIISKYECLKGIKIKMNDKMLKQILIILLSNAYKFSVSGQIILGVTHIEGDKRLRISVSDNGCGISETDKKKLNNLINPLEKNQAINTNESGLGLSIVKTFLKEMGSNLEFVSNKNEGTKFWFDLEYLRKSFLSLTCSLPSVQNEIDSKDTCIQNDIILLKNARHMIRPFTRIYEGTSVISSMNSFSKVNSQKILINGKNTTSHFDNRKGKESEINCNKIIISSKFQKSERSKVVEKRPSNILVIEFQEDKEVEEDYIIEYINSKKNKKSHCEFDSPKSNRTYILESADEISNSFLNNSNQKSFVGSKKSKVDNCSPNNIYVDHQPELKTFLNIIVCDKEKIILNATSNIIRKVTQSKNIDVNIITCSNGTECLNAVYEAYIKKQEIDFLFIDESLPFIRGSLVTNLIKTIAREKRINDIIIYVVTSLQDKLNIRLIESRDCNGVIEKPITATVLREIFTDF